MAVPVYAELPVIALLPDVGYELIVHSREGKPARTGSGVFQALHGDIEGKGYLFLGGVLSNGCFLCISAV